MRAKYHFRPKVNFFSCIDCTTARESYEMGTKKQQPACFFFLSFFFARIHAPFAKSVTCTRRLVGVSCCEYSEKFDRVAAVASIVGNGILGEYDFVRLECNSKLVVSLRQVGRSY